jgi:hypothetical protein
MMIPAKSVDPRLLTAAPLAGSVIKASALASVQEAQGIVEQAQREAARLIDEARARVEEEVLDRQAELEQRAWRKAADYAAAVNDEWERALGEFEARMADVLGRAVRRLVGEAPAEQRLRMCVQQLTSQIGAPDSGTLLVAEEDHAAMLELPVKMPWPVQASGELSAGAVRLVSAQGRWECDVEGSLERLLQALGVSKEIEMEDDHA